MRNFLETFRRRGKRVFPSDLLSVIKDEFDEKYYEKKYPDVAESSVSGCEHYAFTGWREHRDPTAFFSSSYYLSENDDVRASGMNPFYHYIKYGRDEGRWPLPKSSGCVEHNKLLSIIKEGFDSDFYAANNSDVVAAGCDLLEHYMFTGWKEGRSPSSAFDQILYMEKYKGVLDEDTNPLYYFLVYDRHREDAGGPSHGITEDGNAEQHKRSGALNPVDYDEIADVVSNRFDERFYLSRYPDVAQAGVDAMVHYITTGWIEGRDPCRDFSTSYYLEANPDVARAGVNPFYHYLVSGEASGRRTLPPGGFKGMVLRNLISVEKRVDLWHRGQDCETLDACALAAAIGGKLFHCKRRLVLSIGHDDYTTVTGGVQLCIAEEQLEFNESFVDYLSVFPLHPLPVIADGKITSNKVRIRLNGEYIGITTFAYLADLIVGKPIKNQLPSRIDLIIHALHGHSVSELILFANRIDLADCYFWLHDYFSLCPGYNLLRNDVAYCGAPAAESNACMICIYGEERKRHLARMQELFSLIAFVVVSPSKVALSVWEKASPLPYSAAEVHAHRGLGEQISSCIANGNDKTSLKAAYVGYPVVHKGWPIFVDFVKTVSNGDDYELYHLGLQQQPELPVDYVEVKVAISAIDEMRKALVDNDIDIVILPSIWPETFSLAAFESLASGAYIVTIRDSGNIAAIVERYECGSVFDTADEMIEEMQQPEFIERVKHYRQASCARELTRSGLTSSL